MQLVDCWPKDTNRVCYKCNLDEKFSSHEFIVFSGHIYDLLLYAEITSESVNVAEMSFSFLPDLG